MLVLYDPSTLQHQFIELLGSKLIPALECPQRIESIVAAIRQSSHTLVTVDYAEHTENARCNVQKLITNSHDPDYLHYLRTIHEQWTQRGLIDPDETILPECFALGRLSRHHDGQHRLSSAPKDIYAQSGFFSFDMSAGISAGTWLSALASANLAVQAVERVTGEDREPHKSVLALCRPPGHHCTTRLAGGYCYINNAVVAVDAFRRSFSRLHGSQIPKIAILDLDFHHGNGTQDYFYTDPHVLYVSIHGKDEYPYYSGDASEIGEGRGAGFNFNFPLPAGSNAESYMALLDTAMEKLSAYDPSFLIVSLGFDTFHSDPLGSFQLDTGNYYKIAKSARDRAEIVSVPSVLLLEGGYILDRLGANVCSFLQGWEAAEVSRNLRKTS